MLIKQIRPKIKLPLGRIFCHVLLYTNYKGLLFIKMMKLDFDRRRIVAFNSRSIRTTSKNSTVNDLFDFKMELIFLAMSIIMCDNFNVNWYQSISNHFYPFKSNQLPIHQKLRIKQRCSKTIKTYMKPVIYIFFFNVIGIPPLQCEKFVI